MKKIALISLGCAKNLVDSEVMLGYLRKAGYKFVSNIKKADIIIINTCGFIKPARQEAHETLTEAIASKNASKLPLQKIIAVGCYVQRDKKSLKHKFPEVDTWLGVNDFDKIVDAIEGTPFKHASQCFLYDHNSPRCLSTPPAWTYVKISEGCSHRCGFCAIPLIKGPYRSRNISSIVKEAEDLVSKGIKEINIISQDSTYYGRDLGLKGGLPHLLKNLLKIPSLKWIRILYGYPEEITDSLLEVMQEEKICPYLDLPFQHSDHKILKLMKRDMDGHRVLKLINKIRKKIPDIALRTSLVVGFPGEGSKEFINLKNFVKEAQFNHLGVFLYSREKGTDCYSLGDPVKESIKLKRQKEIMQVQAEISLNKNKKCLHQTMDVLIDGLWAKNPNVYIGRTQFQAPEVDGMVFVNRTNSKNNLINTIQKVEITKPDVYDLYGKIVK